MTAPRAPASLSAHIIPSDIRLGRFVLRPSGQPDSEGRFRWALHGPGSMGVVRRFTHTYTVAIAAVATEAADRSGLDLGLDRATVTTPASVEVPMPKITPPADSPSARRSERSRKGGLARAAKAKAAKAAPVMEFEAPSRKASPPAPVVVKAGEAVAKAPKVATTEPDVTVKAGEAIVTDPIRDALDINKALPDGHPGHAIRRAIREAGAAGVAALEEASRLRTEITAIVTSSGVRIEGAEDLEPVEAVRCVIAELRRPEPATLDEIERALNDLDARRTALFERRERIWAAERARARLALAEEAARAAAAELEAARAEAASLA